MTKRYIVKMHVGYAGMDAYDALIMPDNHTEDELQDEAYYMAVDHASAYGYYPVDEYAPEDDSEEEPPDCYIDSIYGHAVPYDPAKHDGKRAGGGSFEKDFQRLEVQ